MRIFKIQESTVYQEVCTVASCCPVKAVRVSQQICQQLGCVLCIGSRYVIVLAARQGIQSVIDELWKSWKAFKKSGKGCLSAGGYVKQKMWCPSMSFSSMSICSLTSLQSNVRRGAANIAHIWRQASKYKKNWTQKLLLELGFCSF